jgi:hypothetical protein
MSLPRGGSHENGVLHKRSFNNSHSLARHLARGSDVTDERYVAHSDVTSEKFAAHSRNTVGTH